MAQESRAGQEHDRSHAHRVTSRDANPREYARANDVAFHADLFLRRVTFTVQPGPRKVRPRARPEGSFRLTRPARPGPPAAGRSDSPPPTARRAAPVSRTPAAGPAAPERAPGRRLATPPSPRPA